MRYVITLLFGVVMANAQIPQYNVTMTPSDYNLLYTRDIFSDSLLPATFEYQGTYWNNAKIRLKGHSTRYYSKKGYRVKFASTNLFQGLGQINFNAMYTDKSFLREKLAWDLFADMQEMAPLPHYARLYINNNWKGLYLFIDKPDKYFLLNRGRAVGPLFEASDTYAMADLTVQPDSIIKLNYEQTIGTANDYVGLEAMIQSLNAAPDLSFADTVSKYFDLSSVINWFSGNIIMMMGDSYVKSYFLYRDTSKLSQQWTVIPWDYDLSFGRNGDPTIPYPASLMNDDFAYTFPPLSGPSNVLKDRLWLTLSLKERLRQRLDTLLQTVFTEQKMYAKIDSLAAYVQNDVERDPDKWGTYQDYFEHIEALKYYVTARKNYLNKTFINSPSGMYNDVTLSITQLNVPYHFVAFDGRQLATMWFSNMSGLDSVRIQAYPDSTPPNVFNPASGGYVRRWIRVTPYPSTSTFTAKLQWSYKDVALNDREVGSGVQDEHLLRSYNYTGSSWMALSSTLNAFGNFVTIDSITEVNCGPVKYFALLMSDTYTQAWFRQQLNYWHRWFDVKFIDNQNGFVIGDHGTVLRTTNAGSSWIQDTIGFNLPFHSLGIPSLNNMFAVGEYGACYHSGDTGKTWVRVDLSTTNDLLGVTFLNSQDGWIFGRNFSLWETSDGGGTWSGSFVDSAKAIVGIAPTAPGKFSVFFEDGTNVKTNNDGQTWSSGPTFPQRINHVAVFGTTIWVVGDSGFVARSVSSSAWIFISISITENLRGVFVVNDTSAYVAGDDGKIYYTIDDGSNWYAQYTADSHDLNAIVFTDNTHGYAVGNGGTILTTMSSGTLTDVRPVLSQIPNEFILFQNYPNPFNPRTEIRWQMADGGYVTLRVYDVMGREVATLVNQQLQPGSYQIPFNGSNLASGVYFYRFDVSGRSGTKHLYSHVNKMLLLK